MILKGLWRKMRWLILFIVVIVVAAIVIKICRIRHDVIDMVKTELSLSSSSRSKDSPLERTIGSFLFPEQKPKDPPRSKTVDEESDSEAEVPVKRGRKGNRRSGSKTSKYKREEICRKVFEDYFDDYFPTCRPKFLINPKTGRPLELDGYNPRLNLAFEHQGEQHRKYPNAFHKTEDEYRKQIDRDEFKRRRLSDLGIDLIEVSDEVPLKDIESYIKNALQQLGHKQ